MRSGRKQKNNLTKKEQSTTVAYKMMLEKVNNLEASLKKTQDECEKFRLKNHEIEKSYILLDAKLKNYSLITVFEFISSVLFGFSLSYFPIGNYILAFSIGIPAITVYIICVYLTKK